MFRGLFLRALGGREFWAAGELNCFSGSRTANEQAAFFFRRLLAPAGKVKLRVVYAKGAFWPDPLRFSTIVRPRDPPFVAISNNLLVSMGPAAQS